MLYNRRYRRKPFYKPDDDEIDIDKLLFGDSESESDSESAGTTTTPIPEPPPRPEIDVDNLDENDLEAALAAMLEEDEKADTAPQEVIEETVIEPMPESAESAPDADTDSESLLMPEEEIQSELAGGADIDALLASLGGSEGLMGEAEVSEIERRTPDDDLLDQLIAADELKTAEENSAKAMERPAEEWSEYQYDPYDDLPVADQGSVFDRIKIEHGQKISLKKRLLALPMWKFATASVLILFVILGSGFATIFAISQNSEARLEYEMSRIHYIHVEQPRDVSNDASFVSMNNIINVGDTELLLRRLIFGGHSTAFHFDDVFDPDEYIFILHDQDGHLFIRIDSNFEYDLELNPTRQGTTIYFAPLLYTTEQLHLHVQKAGYNSTLAHLAFFFPGGANFPIASHMYDTIPIIAGAGGQFSIANAIFTNTLSEIVYMIEEDPINGTIEFNRDGIRIAEGARSPIMNTPQPMEYFFPEYNLTLGRITFGPVRNLGGGVNLMFRDFFAAFPLNGNLINIPVLFQNQHNLDFEQRIPIGMGHTLVLSRMGTHGPAIILVFHVLDENEQRVRGEISADLVIPTSSGNVSISGQSFFSERYIGTDLVFDTRDYGITSVMANEIFLDVASIQIHLTRTNVNLHLETGVPRIQENVLAVESSIVEAFNTRLAYRAGLHGFGSIRGFSSEVLNNTSIMRHYTPIIAPDAEFMFNAHVVAGAFVNNMYLAIVEEEWLLNDGYGFTLIRNKHQISARLIEDSWVIVNNRILS
ncbi:MAG: hypothetical protein FWG65_12605 [Turicibacter sp.]|nr:hypothetical protein [Turicibacter sp.]